MKRGYVDTVEGQIHYVTAGSGTPLVLLHQGPRSCRNFRRLLPLLATHHRCFAFDTLGFGNSGPAPAGVRFDQLAQSVVHAMDGLGLRKAHLLGFHTGNKIATAIGVRWPERIDRLILCGLSHSFIFDQQKRNAAMHSVVSRFKRFDSTRDEGELMRQWSTAFASIADIWWDVSVLSRHDLGMERFRLLEEYVLDLIQARSSMYESVRANAAYDLMAEMRQLTLPTLVIEFTPPEEERTGPQGPELMKVLPHGQLASFTRSDREMIEWDPGTLAPTILNYLKNAH